eukprot:COSAG06_NODE_51273_length_313_cov_0.728972_2_plen_22_part_01
MMLTIYIIALIIIPAGGKKTTR